MTTKTKYCSTCAWFPQWFKDWYEKHAHEACHNHDKNIGINGTVSKDEADNQFLVDMLELSTFPPVLKQIISVVSYWVVCRREDPWPEGDCICKYSVHREQTITNNAGKNFCPNCHRGYVIKLDMSGNIEGVIPMAIERRPFITNFRPDLESVEIDGVLHTTNPTRDPKTGRFVKKDN